LAARRDQIVRHRTRIKNEGSCDPARSPRFRSVLGAAQHGRISKVGRSHARAMLVEAAWAVAKAPGPLHAFFVRIRARRGHPIAAVALAR
jgi:transposase